MRIIAGLGNPGRDYGETRHNAGWMALDELARRCRVVGEDFRCGGALARCGGLWLFKPLSYMNLCGSSVARLRRDAGVGLEDLLVLVDDLDLPLGSIRLRPGGSSGGHRGLASVAEALGTQEFARVRMGIGPCPAEVDARDFVLSPFAPGERAPVEGMTRRAADAALCWAREGIETAMNRFNRRLQNQQGPDQETPPEDPVSP